MIRAKKSLGQNFLIDKNILNRIVDVTKIKDQTILEVGPGTGNLTSYILDKKPKKIFVVEKDNGLVSKLNEKFNDNINVINDDILKVSMRSLRSGGLALTRTPSPGYKKTDFPHTLKVSM